MRLGELSLFREISTATETQGVLLFGDEKLFTLERPWIPTKPGGEPFKSCIPSGRYTLRSHLRANGDTTLALVNPGHAVYYREADRFNDVGRYKVLIHSANWVDQIVGCIAPGLERTSSDRGPMVTSSRSAMQVILDHIGDDSAIINVNWQDGEP